MRGLDAVRAEFHLAASSATWQIIYELTAPFAHMVNVFDKFTLGTALNYAWILMLLMLLAVVRWLAGGGRAWLLVAALAALGQLLFHGVVGLSAIPVTLGALAVALVLPAVGLHAPPRGRVLAAMVALAVGALAGLPYTRAISAGWSAGASGVQHAFLRPSRGCCGRSSRRASSSARSPSRPARRLARAHATGSFLVAWTLGMLAFSAIVNLPEDNESKFAFQVHFGLRAVRRRRARPVARRRSRGGAAASSRPSCFAALFAAGPLLTLHAMAVAPTVGYPLRDRGRSAAERAAYAWLGRETPRDAVVVDADFRDAIMVLGPAPAVLRDADGTRRRAAFPADEVAERHAVMADLYGPRADLPRARASLGRLGAPAYVVYRANGAKPGLPPEPRRPALVVGRRLRPGVRSCGRAHLRSAPGDAVPHPSRRIPTLSDAPDPAVDRGACGRPPAGRHPRAQRGREPRADDRLDPRRAARACASWSSATSRPTARRRSPPSAAPTWSTCRATWATAARCRPASSTRWRTGYEYIIQIDADGQHDPKSAAGLFAPVARGEADVAIGSRFTGHANYPIPLPRRLGMAVFGAIVTFVTRKTFSDPTSGYQAMNSKVLRFFARDNYPSDFPDADTIILLVLAGFRVIEVPVVMQARTAGTSMHSNLKAFYYVSKMMLSILMVLLRRKVLRMPIESAR